MFYCDPCRDSRSWPNSFVKSTGRCELCGQLAACNDVPSASLPYPPEFGAAEIAEIEAKFDRIALFELSNSRFFLSVDGVESQVTAEEWVEAERACGFYNTQGHPERPATAGFGSGNVKGRVEFGD